MEHDQVACILALHERHAQLANVYEALVSAGFRPEHLAVRDIEDRMNAIADEVLDHLDRLNYEEN